MMEESYFIGIDVGTQGARVVLMSASGELLNMREEVFPLDGGSQQEQPPNQWWEVCLNQLKALTSSVATTIDLRAVKAVAVTSTSGTVIPVDGKMEPLHNAIMYSDPRSAEEGRECRDLALKYTPEGYTGFNASSGLSKMVWFARNYPEAAGRIAKWLHAVDFVTGKLCGRWGVTDFTNALKSGVDLRTGQWPDWIYTHLPVRQESLPTVVAAGEPLGTLTSDVARFTGLQETTVVVAGMTDGCASQIASGAVRLGDWNTTIGTTLVVKGVTRDPVADAEGRIYSHRHPEGFWMPGGASNTGADWVTRDFSDNLQALNLAAAAAIPTGEMAWPLVKKGERFPFIAPHASGFSPAGLDRVKLFAANMEGVAYIERYAFELIESLSGEKVGTIYTAGGGSKSDTWLKIRANVLNRPIVRMKYVSGAVGAAILAASKTHFRSVSQATAAMTIVEKQVVPDARLSDEYDGHYKRFLDALVTKNYITRNPFHA